MPSNSSTVVGLTESFHIRTIGRPLIDRETRDGASILLDGPIRSILPIIALRFFISLYTGRA